MSGLMNKIRLLIHTVFRGGPDTSALDEEYQAAKRRHDFAVRDLHNTMEQLTSVTEGKKK